MPRATVVGAGMSPFGHHDAPLEELFADAALPAMDDAGVSADEVDAFYFGNALAGQTENDTHLGLQGIPCQRFEDACATSSNAFKHAVQAVESGIHDVALVGGVERCTSETGLDTDAMTRIFASASHRRYEVCINCGGRELVAVELPTRGKVYSETTIKVTPEGFDGPYQVVIVELGGVHLLVRVDDTVEIGDVVEFSGTVVTEDLPAPVFEPVE